MTNRERFHRVMNFESVDRLPLVEWAMWWRLTTDRWRQEGMPTSLSTDAEIRAYFGLDSFEEYWMSASGSAPAPVTHGAGVAADAAEYRTLRREHLYPDRPFNPEVLADWADRQRAGELVVWLEVDGFFWFPRVVLGIQRHLYAFYDQPELIHEINRDLLAFHLRSLEQFCEICVPDFVIFAEDMSYNHGPMISQELFQEFIAPYYQQLTPALAEHDIIIIVDSDGDVTAMVPWMEEVGVQGFLPLERQAGVDVNQLRRDHPQLLMVGAFDKMVMHQGEEAMRREFERLLLVMRSGGYIPSVDHQTPPAVSLEDYRLYVRLLREYTTRAAKQI